MKAIEILLLVLPVTAWALWNDRNGDEHKNLNDIFWEASLIINVPFYIRIYEVLVLHYESAKSFTEWLSIYLPMYAVSITGFGLFFTYSFNWYWFSKYFYGSFEGRLYYTLTHLSNKAVPDRWKWWRACGWFGRLLIYLVLFGLSVYWFTIG